MRQRWLMVFKPNPITQINKAAPERALSVTKLAYWRPVIEPAWRVARLFAGQYCSHFKS
jgi:hypothetical protein